MRPRRPRHNRATTKARDATDQHILRLHLAMVDKLLADPTPLTHLYQVLEQRYQAGQLRHSAYIHWHSILDCIDQPEIFRRELLDQAERMCKLRRRTILVGILTEQERIALLYPPPATTPTT
ncbi:hypothetical protein WG68_08940 [Arsukibacterium ikkense]|uniref:Uncharacterized protein n=1 Tax=Arsukibacterium ikkense TaxID=336831 RepID=A0A0M2V5Z8_9GAMM|nr:hypothetical protein [Arsukibacterium ikkense]KKO45824.1 hypothetical protein WG68_08940 [Arsukibacterium ikkense]